MIDIFWLFWIRHVSCLHWIMRKCVLQFITEKKDRKNKNKQQIQDEIRMFYNYFVIFFHQFAANTEKHIFLSTFYKWSQTPSQFNSKLQHYWSCYSHFFHTVDNYHLICFFRHGSCLILSIWWVFWERTRGQRNITQNLKLLRLSFLSSDSIDFAYIELHDRGVLGNSRKYSSCFDILFGTD